MYPRSAFALLFSFAAIGLGLAIPAFPSDERCGPNALFLECGSACAPTCASRKYMHPGPVCTLQCVQGCFCREGYLKNAQGQCVREDECDGQTHPRLPMQIPSAAFVAPTCPDNEEFKSCGSACVPTCAKPVPSPVCTKQCVIGCFCKEGLMRNGNGVCVPANQCEVPEPVSMMMLPPVQQCKENEIFLSCGSACAPTCDKPNPGPICTLQCVIGCFCKPGYLKNSHGVCVPATQCGAPVCGENEEYRQCKGCDGTCDKPNPICPRICVPGCACKEGHLRAGKNGQCIPKKDCPAVTHQCPQGEVFQSCGTACPATCANPNPTVCTRQCVIGCFCKNGQLRNEQGVCVDATNCDAPKTMLAMLNTEAKKCPTDREVYVEECGNQVDCVGSCHVVTFLVRGAPHIPKKCMVKMCKPACVCQHPYVRNEHGQCVERKECDQPFTTQPPVMTTTH